MHTQINKQQCSHLNTMVLLTSSCWLKAGLTTIKTMYQVYTSSRYRHTRKLLNFFGLKAELLSCHDHNEKQRVAGVLQRLKEGQVRGRIFAFISGSFMVPMQCCDVHCKLLPPRGCVTLPAFQQYIVWLTHAPIGAAWAPSQ